MLNRPDTFAHPGICQVSAPPLVPDQAIDRTHLFKMTLGDHRLEAEVLRLFDRQATILLGRMNAADPAVSRALAHTINGSARGIGAWRVAQAAAAVEQAKPEPDAIEPALAALRAATDEAKAAIAELLRAF